MAIEFFYFDLGNVLLDFSHQRGCDQIAVVAGVTPEDVRSALFDSGLNDRYERGEVTTEQFHREFSHLTATETPLIPFLHAWSDIFELHVRTIPIVFSLRAAGHRVGLLSNTCQAHWEFVVRKYAVLSTFFDPVVTSYEAKAMKPESKIYEFAASRAGVAPSDIFFVDDRLENVEGARSCGWHAEQFATAIELGNALTRLGVRFSR